MDPFFYPVILAGAMAGASAGLLGVFMVGLRLPFIGTCISHAAMAGAVWGTVFGLNPMVSGVIVSAGIGVCVSGIRPDRHRVEGNIGLAILFSLMLGLTFLGIGMQRGARSEILGLLWGSVLLVNWQTVWIVGITGGILMGFAWLFAKELKAILFSRTIAAATGIHEGFVYLLLLLLTALVLSVNLPAVGGILIFSLMINPAAAAYQVCRGYRAVVIVSVLLGMLSAVGGFFFSYVLDLPTGACIVLVSGLIFFLCWAFRQLGNRQD